MTTRRKTKRMAREDRKQLRPMTGETEQHRLFLWRKHELEKAGLDSDAARRIAETDYDLHSAIAMLDAGCSPALLLSIVL